LRTAAFAAAPVALWLVAAGPRGLPPTASGAPAGESPVPILGMDLVLLALVLWVAIEKIRMARRARRQAGDEWRRTGAPLLESEQRLALALDAASDGLYDIDLATGTGYCSPRYFTMLGYSPDELPSSLATWQQLLHPDDRAAAEAVVASYREGRAERHSIETRLRAKDGSWRWVLSRGRLSAPDATGAPRRLVGTHVDITARRDTEQALAKERDLVARLVETSPSGILVVDAAGLVIFANNEAERILALRRTAPDGHRYAPPDWQLCAPDGSPVPEDERAFRRVLLTGRPIHDIRHLLRWGSGRAVLLSVNAAPLFDAAGRIEAVVSTLDDITDRQHSEDLLRENEERLRSIVDHAPFGSHLFELQTDGRLLLQAANQSADAILHLDHHPLLGRDILEAFPGLRGTGIPDTYRRGVADSRPCHNPRAHYAATNASGVFDIHALPLGRNRVVVFFIDITERERAEAALRLSEERYRHLFNSGNDSLLVHGFRPDGSPDRFTQVNDIACQLLGYPRETLLTLSARELTPPDLLARSVATTAELRRERHALFETEMLASDGRRIPVEINSRLIELEGRTIIFSIVRDVTERRRLEDQLRQAQKMEVFGQLAGGVAHDFNNLLVSILCNADLLLDSPALEARLRDQAAQIQEAGRRAAALTRQLLLFARKQPAQTVPCDLGEILAEHVKLLHRIIGEDIELVLELVSEPLPIVADVNMVEQVAMNLVVNARDAMPRGGTLTLRTARAILDREAAARCSCPPGEYAAFVVRDTGCGIPAAVRTRIFEPFFTTKPAGQGTGLGLSTVLGIVQQHRGGIALASQEGHGTEFTIYLPLALCPTPAATPAAAPPGSARPAAPATLLVIEDDAAVRTIVDRALGEFGYSVRLATNGAEGLEQLERGADAIDLVLSDVVMPGGLDGGELAEMVATRWPAIPVLLMSGYAKDLERTGVRILQKPFSTAQLLAFVGEGLAGRAHGTREPGTASPPEGR